MNIRRRIVFLSFVALLVSLSTMAKPRTKQQMQAIAQQAIVASGKTFAPSANKSTTIHTINARTNLSLIGFEGGAYAVVSNDDELPEVLGVSSTSYSGGANKNFEWWLQVMDKALSEAKAKGIKLKVTTPDPSKYPTRVDPLLTAKWDQGIPYNNYLPMGIYTGCVATAMAQVLYYHKAPVHGVGTSSVYVNTTYYTNHKVTATFSEDYYDWDNMIDEYNFAAYNETQANAVALLMRDCGVAAKMQYGGDDEEGSGAYLSDAAEGLRKYFGFNKAEHLERDYFSESAWMNRVYKELSTRGPIIYGGADLVLWAAHAFVLHGYREDGKVYVNWGWSGEDDGWFDIATLQMPGYSFSSQQDMILGIEAVNENLEEATIDVATPGTLQSLLPENSSTKLGKLTLSGTINSTDLCTLRKLAGVDNMQNSTDGSLQTLDLVNVNIVSGGEPYLIDGTSQLTTTNDELPERAFYGCGALREITLPASIKTIGNGALSGMPGLQSIKLSENPNQLFAFDSDVIYADKTKKVITNLLQTISDQLIINDNVEELAPYALAGTRLQAVRFGASLSKLNAAALKDCHQLRSIRITSSEIIPSVTATTLSGINYVDCKLYVPSGMKEIYKTLEGWKNFAGTINYNTYDNIIEYGTVITVRNAIREYGEANPTFGYVVSGETPFGVPRIYCDATASSPAGEYIISIDQGTLVGDFIELKSGTLYVQPAPLTASLAQQYTKYEGEENPEFQLLFSGFKLDDGEEVMISMPEVTTDATTNSTPGEYTVYIKGGETNGNYELTYENGILIVEARPTNINEIVHGNDINTLEIYTLDGRKVHPSQLRNGIYIVNNRKVVITNNPR